MALTKDGNVHVWGWIEYSQLGISGSGSVPQRISFPDSEIASIVCLRASSMVVTKEGNIWSSPLLLSFTPFSLLVFLLASPSLSEDY